MNEQKFKEADLIKKKIFALEEILQGLEDNKEEILKSRPGKESYLRIINLKDCYAELFGMLFKEITLQTNKFNRL